MMHPFHSDPVGESIKWSGEGADLGVDPGSGAVIRRLTSGPMMNHLIYCEQPYASPDGKRVAIIRGRDFTFENDFSLLIGEPDTLLVARLERSIPRSIVHNSWSEWLYYLTHARGLRRISLLTLKKEQVLGDNTFREGCDVASITPDNRLVVCSEGRGSAVPEIVTYDTATGERRLIYSHPDNNNAHLQVEPVGGQKILMQLIAGSRLGPDGKPGRATGVPVLIMNRDGSDPQFLPIGGKHSTESSGHMAWITGTQRIACAIGWNRDEHKHDPRHPQGNLAIAGVGDDKPRIFAAPEHGFYHVSISKCGRYFVCDDFMDCQCDVLHMGPIRIVVGNLITGKYRVLVKDVLALGLAGGSNWEPDPYFTADNRYVVYNASPFGANQVHVAGVPPAFLASLD